MPPTEPKLRVLVRHSATAKDVALAGELLQHLDPLKRFAGVDVWSEARVRPGDNWREEIRLAIDQADVALVLLSSDFLSTDGLLDVEVPHLLERQGAESLRIIPVILRSCLWQVHPGLKDLTPLPKGGKAVGSFSGDARDEVLTELAKEIVSLASASRDDAGPRRSPDGSTPPAVSQGPTATPTATVEVSIARLPSVDARIFGRGADAAWLDACWAEGANVASIVAFGGVGKSALVWDWLRGMQRDGWRGAERVYGWSFYSQGTTDRATSADEFISATLRWFGDPDPNAGRPGTRGRGWRSSPGSSGCSWCSTGSSRSSGDRAPRRGASRTPPWRPWCGSWARRTPGCA